MIFKVILGFALAASVANAQGTCGNGSRGNGICANGQCCSQYGWCGTTSAHCAKAPTAPAPTAPAPAPTSKGGTCGSGSRGNGICANGQCCSQYGWCGTTSAHCSTAAAPTAPAPTAPAPTTTVGGTCGNGSRGNGICSNGQCCSQYGWCGTTSAHCNTAPAPTAQAPTGPTPTGPTTGFPPARTLTLADVQAGVNQYNSFYGRSDQVSQYMVNELNRVTRGYTLYRQLAFVAQLIWESGAFLHREEYNAVNPPFSTRYNYQQCLDRSYAPNDKAYYGRGFIQLSWCSGYERYGRARPVNGDPDYFKKNPEMVAQDPYALESAVWVFEATVADTTGQFGRTTNSINGPIECNPANNHVGPSRRYAIFEAMARRLGLTGYSNAGCLP